MERMPGRVIKMRVNSYNQPSPSIMSINVPNRNIQQSPHISNKPTNTKTK